MASLDHLGLCGQQNGVRAAREVLMQFQAGSSEFSL
jgi:hypothetical protein